MQPELLGRGVAFVNVRADHDGDGDLDLFVGFNGTPNRLYRSDAGRLTDVEVTSAPAGRRQVARVRGVRPPAWRGRVLTVRVDGGAPAGHAAR